MLLLRRPPPPRDLFRRPRCPVAPRRLLSAVPHPEPLRILFCGSDHFSATSLKALYAEYASPGSSLIGSIDVVCKEDKRTGRNLRTLREVPIKDVARELRLPIHEIAHFRKDWNLPTTTSGHPPNLIVAVSFGLLIPARLLAAAAYGGINVHPSLLPMYRGPAPIYHTLLNRTPITGVTVQTLSPGEFDKGDILLQTTPAIPVPERTPYQALHDALAVHGAEMLVEVCKRRLFVPPIAPVMNAYPPSHAPKIDVDVHARADWRVLSAEEVERKCGVLGTVWCRFGSAKEPLLRNLRVILADVSVLDLPEESIDGEEVAPGWWQYLRADNGEEVLAVKCMLGGGWVRVGGIKVEGKKMVQGGEWARSVREKEEEEGGRRFMAVGGDVSVEL